MDQSRTSHWPLFDLRIRTEHLELRLPTDADLMTLVEVVREGVHDPATMPFLVPWTDLPSPELERQFLRFMWGTRASWSATDWQLPFAVIEEGKPIGVQALRATDFPARRVVDTGSWLGRRHQGRGVGTEMRAAVLRLAFDGLGATMASSGALSTNHASARISEKLGYTPNGTTVVAPRGVPVEERLFLLRREDWRPDRYPAAIDGLDGCLDMFGSVGARSRAFVTTDERLHDRRPIRVRRRVNRLTGCLDLDASAARPGRPHGMGRPARSGPLGDPGCSGAVWCGNIASRCWQPSPDAAPSAEGMPARRDDCANILEVRHWAVERGRDLRPSSGHHRGPHRRRQRLGLEARRQAGARG